MSPESAYSDEFFQKVDAQGQSSARVVVPWLLQWHSLQSVLDVGCGRGAWLSVFLELGVPRVRGVDGPWVDPAQLLIPASSFSSTRLDRLEPEPRASHEFDLALCLEVAEHLPANQSAQLIAYLTSQAPVVLFSAAIPGQQGTEHINEQWPEFWEALFRSHGHTRLDPVRPRVWRDSRVAWYYQQNLYVFVSEQALAESTIWQAELHLARSSPLTLIHPKVLHSQRSFLAALRQLPTLLGQALQRRFWNKPSWPNAPAVIRPQSTSASQEIGEVG